MTGVWLCPRGLPGLPYLTYLETQPLLSPLLTLLPAMTRTKPWPDQQVLSSISDEESKTKTKDSLNFSVLWTVPSQQTRLAALQELEGWRLLKYCQRSINPPTVLPYLLVVSYFKGTWYYLVSSNLQSIAINWTGRDPSHSTLLYTTPPPAYSALTWWGWWAGW